MDVELNASDIRRAIKMLMAERGHIVNSPITLAYRHDYGSEKVIFTAKFKID